jgi:hypothetical protein
MNSGRSIGAMASLLMLVLGTTAAVADSDKSTVTVDDVVNAWGARARRVKTLRFKWTERRVLQKGEVKTRRDLDPDNPKGLVVPDQPNVFNKMSLLVIDDDKIRYERLDLTLSVEQHLVPQESMWVFANEEYRRLMPPAAAWYFRGHVGKEIYSSLPPFNDPNVAPLLINYRPFHSMFTTFQSFKKRFRVVAGKHSVEGRDCILLKDEPWGPSQISMSLFLDPARDFLVMSQLVEGNKNATLSCLTFLDYRQQNGDWVPVRWMTTFGNGAGEDARRNAPRVTEFSLGEKIDPREFELEFPPGTWVLESGRPTSYLVKEGGKQRTITRKEQSVAKFEQLMQTETGTLAIGPDTTDDPTARRDKLAEIRRGQVAGLAGWGVWNCLVARDEGLEVRIELVAEHLHPDDPVEVVVTEESCNQMLFGKLGTEAAAREELSIHLQRNIESIDRICRLSDAQKQKLVTAGSGEFSRFFKQTEGLRLRIRNPLPQIAVNKGALDEKLNMLLEETRPRRRMVNSGIFDSGSLFAKTLRTTLTADQAAAYEASQSELKPAENP